MFTKDDYVIYLEQLMEVHRSTLTIVTDIMNDVANQEIKNKLRVIANEDLNSFRFLRSQKEKFV